MHGGLADDTLADVTRASIDIEPVATAQWFPGYRNGATMVVVDRAGLQSSRIGLATEVWIHDPPPDAVEQLQASGWLVRGAQNVSDVFEVTSFLTVRWSYAVLTAFGILIGIVVVVAQVLVLDARRRSRQAAVVVARRMGFDLRSEATAIFVELAVPFIAGAVIGHRRRSGDRARGHRPPRHAPQPAATGARHRRPREHGDRADDRGRGAPRARRPGHDHDRQDQTDGGDAQCRVTAAAVTDVAVRGDRLTRRFATPAGTVLAVDDVDVEIATASLTAVAGPSGSGKSVLLSMISCTDRPSLGTVRVGDVRVTQLGRRARRRFRREQLGIVLPQPSDNLLLHMSAIENARWAMRVRRGRRGHDAVDERARELMDAVGIGDLGAKQIRQLSGGEQQRLALVCALMGEPAVLVADEPTASLDATSSIAVVEALRALADRGVTMIVATHDHHVIDVADTVIRLDHGARVA